MRDREREERERKRERGGGREREGRGTVKLTVKLQEINYGHQNIHRV